MTTGTGPTETFKAALADDRLIIQRCAACDRAFHRPRMACPVCGSSDWSWEEATGQGTVYSVTTVARPPRPFRDDGVYQLAMVDLDEGARVMGRVTGAAVGIGQRITFRPDRTADGTPRIGFKGSNP